MTLPAAVVHDDSAPTDAPWWRQAAVYQIYPRSFADASGDGLGDIRGILSRVDYLAELGIDAVWLSPFYPSELADGGYDVAAYRDVDPRLGTLADFDAMVAALHERGIRVVVDIVPNHTSDRHAWFQEALAAGRGSAARERYIFREGTGPDGSEPPTDWTAAFGGSAAISRTLSGRSASAARISFFSSGRAFSSSAAWFCVVKIISASSLSLYG